ncbi:MAG: M23 family metallopeptidase [Magnetococcales bacterium]|nr:M23 family metallopeptidase [Magnetococcales bacterium]
MRKKPWLTLLLPTLLLGCAGPIGAAPPEAAPARVAVGPPLAGDLAPKQRQMQPAKGDHYVVQPGDTLWAIATAHNLDLELLAEWNRIDKPEQIKLGDRLRITPPPTPARPGRQPPKKPILKTEPPEPDTRTPLAKPVPQAPLPREWLWPHEGRIITRFGPQGLQRSTGIDLEVAPGDAILASADGVVAYAGGGAPGLGNILLLRHGGPYMTAYGHLQKFLVKRGESVTAGQEIAKAGQSGITPSPRLHFEIRHGIRPVNPVLYLPIRHPTGKPP